MQFIRSALGDDVDHGAAVAAILGLHIGDNAQFGNGVERENGCRVAEDARFIDGRIVAETIVHVGAVEQEIVGAAAGAVHREGSE